MSWRIIPLVIATASCALVNRPARPPVFARGVWRVRIDVDSAPTRRPSQKAVFGTIDFAAHRHAIDFWVAINHKLPPTAYVDSAIRADQPPQPSVYKIVLGDSGSFDEKIVMLGRAVTPDSLVGTWSETIVCCSAAGRFSLWRAPARP